MKEPITKYLAIILAVAFGVVLVLGIFSLYEREYNTTDEALGTDLRVFTVRQGGTGTSTIPVTGSVLVGLSDGTYAPRATSTLGISGSGSVGGVSDWFTSNGALTPTTTIGIRVKASSTITGLTVDSDATTTGKLVVQGTATSTFVGGIDVGSSIVTAHGAKAFDSSGFHIHSSNGTGVAYFGVAGGSNSTFEGGVNIDGATRLATSLSGLLYANTGSVLATATGTLTETATGLELSATRGLVDGSAILSLTSGYTIPTTTRANNWDTAFSWGNHAGLYDVLGQATSSLSLLTASGGITRTINNFAPTTGYNIPLTASTTNWEAFYLAPSNRITAGNALTWSSNTIDFDGGATPSGDLGGTWASPSVTDDSHAHTGTTLSGIDISSDTNLTVDGVEIILTGDALSLGDILTFTTATSSTSFQTNLLGIGTDYISDITGSGLTLTNGVLSATASGGSASDWKQLGGFLTPTTTIGIAVPSASTMGTTTHSGSLLLGSNDGGALGALGTAWSDLFLASGSVINMNNGDVTITHAGNQLTFNGASSGYTFNNLISGTDISLTGLLDAGGAALEIPNGAAPTVDSIGEIALDSTSNQLVLYGSAKKVYGDGNFYPSFTYATSTAWTGTTTVPLGATFTGETWNAVKCFTDVGTVNVDFGDGTNWMNATTSVAVNPVPTHTLSTNNTFTAGETRYARVGTPVSSPTKISCTVSKSITSD